MDPCPINVYDSTTLTEKVFDVCNELKSLLKGEIYRVKPPIVKLEK